MNLDLEHKNAMVCGSTQGIGKAAAMELAKMGATVTLVARNEKKLQKVCVELPSDHQQKHAYIVADFQEPKALKQVLEDHLKESPDYHILVNNTGGPPAGAIFSAEILEFEKAFNQHLICNHILVQALVPGMQENGYGRIINVISTSVKQPLDGLGVSNTIRGAVGNWAKTLANELGQFNITVNNVLPGATATERLTSIIENKAEKTDTDAEKTAQKMKDGVPMKRFAAPEEIAYAITFLASEAASYINGINLPVDGGRTKSL